MSTLRPSDGIGAALDQPCRHERIRRARGGCGGGADPPRERWQPQSSVVGDVGQGDLLARFRG